VKVGDLQAKLGRYKEAIDVYEKTTNMAIDDKLLTWGVRDYLMKAVMCQLADMKNMEEVIYFLDQY
jgi:alpha-soluble NSF attachment protein